MHTRFNSDLQCLPGLVSGLTVVFKEIFVKLHDNATSSQSTETVFFLLHLSTY